MVRRRLSLSQLPLAIVLLVFVSSLASAQAADEPVEDEPAVETEDGIAQDPGEGDDGATAEAGDGTAPGSEEGEPEPQSLFDSTILADLESTRPAELLDWARVLGLSTRGSRREVEDRILEYYGLDRANLPVSEEPDGSTSLARIERARGSEFFTVEQTDEQYLRLAGGVILTMEDGDAVHRIEAQEITLNLDRNTLAAIGGVTYTTDRPDGSEQFAGDTIVFEIDTWEGIFIQGITETREDLEAEEVEFSVQGELISRSSQEIIVVDRGTITSSRADPPNYRIRAQRIWILAPGEWGLRRAVLYVGRVPTFYLPVFFLPGDRLFFHPAVGTETREGAFIQTTTYFIGQSEERDAPVSIMQLAETPDDSERVIDGLFLRIPDEPVEPDPPDWSLKLMADVYTTLGAYTGVDGSLPSLGPFNRLDWRVGIAASRNIYFDNGVYSSWYVDEDGNARQHWNSGFFFGRTTPFRYEGEISTELSLASLSVSLEMLLLSDPEFRRDFADRSEGMDWSFLLNSATEGEEEESDATVSSAQWQLNLSWRPRLPDAVVPWVDNFSVTTFRTVLDWRTRDADDLPDAVTLPESNLSPEERFFYPQSLLLPELALQFGGTLIRWPRPATALPDDDTEEDDPSDAEHGEAGPVLRPPWEETPRREDDEAESEFRLPDLAGNAGGIDLDALGGFSLGYTVRPTLRYDRFTDSDEWDGGGDVALDWEYSTFQTRNRMDLTATTRDAEGFFTVSNSLALEQRYQDVSIEADLTESEIESLRTAAFRFRLFSATQNSSVSLFPLLRTRVFDTSSLSYTLNSLVYRWEFEALEDDDSPRYDSRWGDWNEEDISTHQTVALLQWDQWGAQQRVRATSNLPPLNGAYDGSVTLITGPLTTELEGGYRETDDEGWRPDPFNQNHRLHFFGGGLTLGQDLEYDVEAVELTEAATTLNAWFLTMGLIGRRSTGFRFVDGSGWETIDDERFRWTDLSVGFDLDAQYRFWKRRINIELTGDVALNFDLQQYTSSRLILDYGINFDIYRFLQFQLTARTTNDLIYRYVEPLAEEVGLPERNLVEDFVNSLRLFNREAREESFFNLDSISLSAVHDLEDWELSATYTGRPELETENGISNYRWRGIFSILIRWRSISELRRNIEVEDGTVEFVQ